MLINIFYANQMCTRCSSLFFVHIYFNMELW